MKVSGHARFHRGLLHPRHWGGWLGLGLLILLAYLPARARMRLGGVLGELNYRRSAKRRRISDINLRLAFPDWTRAERRRVQRAYFRHAGRSMLDYGTLWWRSPAYLRSLFEVQGREHLQRLHEQGRPIIVLTVHTLALDAGATWFALEDRVTGPFKRPRSDFAHWLVARMRTRLGTAIVEREEGLRPLVRDVQQGRLLYYIPDEDLGREASVFAPYLGVEKATVPVLGRLARLCGKAAVLPVLTTLDGESGRYRVSIKPPLEDFPREETASARRMNAVMAALVQECPEQYMWSLRLFHTRPDGGTSPYRAGAPLPPRVE